VRSEPVWDAATRDRALVVAARLAGDLEGGAPEAVASCLRRALIRVGIRRPPEAWLQWVATAVSDGRLGAVLPVESEAGGTRGGGYVANDGRGSVPRRLPHPVRLVGHPDEDVRSRR